MSRQNTILVDRYKTDAGQQTSVGRTESYKGYTIYALTGLHDFIGEKAKQFFPAGANLLDLAAGSGAMSLRMSDCGFEVTATDYVAGNFKIPQIRFIQADLNECFAEKLPHKFQTIIASEIIEHLENPRHFARECFMLLEPGGRLILSTPNIENAGSKLSFLQHGRFFWFYDKDYEFSGHITPLTHWQIRRSFEEAGFIQIWEGSHGVGASRLHKKKLKQMAARMIDWIAHKGRALTGEIYVTVMEKPEEPETNQP